MPHRNGMKRGAATYHGKTLWVQGKKMGRRGRKKTREGGGYHCLWFAGKLGPIHTNQTRGVRGVTWGGFFDRFKTGEAPSQMENGGADFKRGCEKTGTIGRKGEGYARKVTKGEGRK